MLFAQKPLVKGRHAGRLADNATKGANLENDVRFRLRKRHGLPLVLKSPDAGSHWSDRCRQWYTKYCVAVMSLTVNCAALFP